MFAQFPLTHHIARLWWTLENYAFTSCNTHVRKNSVWNASASSRLISLSLKDVFAKVKFDDASKLLARVPVFLQNDTLSVFLQTKKSVFGVRQPILTSVSTNDPCVPQKLWWRPQISPRGSKVSTSLSLSKKKPKIVFPTSVGGWSWWLRRVREFDHDSPPPTA